MRGSQNNGYDKVRIIRELERIRLEMLRRRCVSR